MNKKYLLKNSEKAGKLLGYLQKQLISFLCLLLSIFFYPVGILLAVFYFSVSDALQNGQSVGKKLMGFNVISMEDGEYCSIKQSIIRNLTTQQFFIFCSNSYLGMDYMDSCGFFLFSSRNLSFVEADSGNRLGCNGRYNRERNDGPEKGKASLEIGLLRKREASKTTFK